MSDLDADEAQQKLDSERLECLIGSILIDIRANYEKGPVDRHRVYEALSALAFCAGWVIHGCNDDPEALQFFSDVLNSYLSSWKGPKES